MIFCFLVISFYKGKNESMMHAKKGEGEEFYFLNLKLIMPSSHHFNVCVDFSRLIMQMNNSLI